MLRWVLAAAVLSLGAAGCGGGTARHAGPTTPEASSPASPASTVVSDAAPAPEHVTFAPGETISAPGKAGIFFVDPYTGGAEAWVVPGTGVSGQPGATNFSFTIGGVSDDGSKIVYECQQYVGNNLVLCGDDPSVHRWYLFDTKTGARTPLSAFSGPFADISPDGRTLIGTVGAQRVAFASVDAPAKVRPLDVDVPVADLLPPNLAWSPDSSRIVLTTDPAAPRTSIVRVADLTAVTIGGEPGAWSHDGRRLATNMPGVGGPPTGIALYDRDGKLLWSKAISATVVGWSGDDRMILVDTIDDHGTAAAEDDSQRVDVVDAATGATRLRVDGALCPGGWLGDRHAFLTDSYGSGTAIVDADAERLRKLTVAHGYPYVVPFDASMVIAFDGNDFYRLDPETDQETLIARTTVSPAWDGAHTPLFAGKRITFAPLHLGHGGCGEGSAPNPVPQIRVVPGPFADDAPITGG